MGAIWWGAATDDRTMDAPQTARSPATRFGPRDFRDALGRFATGVCVASTHDRGRPIGLTVNSFTALSLDPPLVLFCIGAAASGRAAFLSAPHFAINVLAEDQQDISRRFAASMEDPFEGLGYDALESGAPVLAGALAAIDCARDAVHPGGDHDILVGRVLALSHRAGRPLLYFSGAYERLAGPC